MPATTPLSCPTVACAWLLTCRRSPTPLGLTPTCVCTCGLCVPTPLASAPTHLPIHLHPWQRWPQPSCWPSCASLVNKLARRVQAYRGQRRSGWCGEALQLAAGKCQQGVQSQVACRSVRMCGCFIIKCPAGAAAAAVRATQLRARQAQHGSSSFKSSAGRRRPAWKVATLGRRCQAWGRAASRAAGVGGSLRGAPSLAHGNDDVLGAGGEGRGRGR